jgi:hypothetical protein
MAKLTIKLSDGTEVHTTTDRPSKRSNKNKSGRSGRKQWNSIRTTAKVGGYSGDYRGQMKAIAAPADQPLCFVRTTTHSDNRLNTSTQRMLGLRPAGGSYTWDLGGSASTGYIAGRGA